MSSLFSLQNLWKYTKIGCSSYVFLTYVARPINVYGPSMLPTFDEFGDVVISSYLPVYFGRYSQEFIFRSLKRSTSGILALLDNMYFSL